MLRVGIDIGSTTAKMVAVSPDGKVFFSRYGRHNARAKETVSVFLKNSDVKRMMLKSPYASPGR